MRKHWLAFWTVIVLSFAVLGWVGGRIYQEMPPIPDRVVTNSGSEVIAPGDILAGQAVWRALGGMEVGSVWGHGSYVAPDWTADWLHRESVFMLDSWSRKEYGTPFEATSRETQAILKDRLVSRIRTNGYDLRTGTLTIDEARAEAFESNFDHYSSIFRDGRKDYAIQTGALKDPAKLRQLSAFFFWTAWAAAAERPGLTISYTNNWPHEPLVGNRLTGDALVWTGVSIICLLAGISALVTFFAKGDTAQALAYHEQIPTSDPLTGLTLTPSQRATLKYFLIVSALFLVQIVAGVITAHYGVEGHGFYGVPLASFLPYSVTRTWHVQIGVLWIAVAWLASGLFIGPLVGGSEPKGQRLGVNVLFGALLALVVGSLAGQWLSIMGRMSPDQAFYFGHQGYEYVDLGRVFQAGLFGGLLLWFFLVFRAVRPALSIKPEERQTLLLFLVSAGAIGLFYGAGLMWGPKTHLTLVEYWRWWVVHLWVEGFFEVFASVVIAYFFMKLGLTWGARAAKAALFAATIYLAGGIIGTLHHLYFSGTPTVALALGATFSALEVVPLTLVAFGAWEHRRHLAAASWMTAYKWPVYFFLAVAFWNMVGAGIFGFMINPPVALYFMQGLNTTPVHGHAALFGVYGMLGIGLTLFCLRAADPALRWNERAMSFAFWALNGGLSLMILLSLLPVGLLQTWASVEHSYFYARSAEFLQTPMMSTLRWMRIPGDTIFALGALVEATLIIGLVSQALRKHK